jgi:two-component system sensor histidine kinase YesM
MKLNQKFLVAFLFISIIPIFLITSFTYGRYTNLVNQQTTQVAENVFEKAVDSANSSIANISHIAEIFTFYSGSNNSIIDDLKRYDSKSSRYTTYDVFKSNENIKFICQNLIYSSHYINGIFVFTPSGVILGYGYGGGIDVKPGYEPFSDHWYQKTVALKGKKYVDGITTKDFLLNSSPSISFSQALYDIYTHEFLGVLYIDCSPGIFDMGKINTMPNTAMLSIENDSTGYVLYSNADTFQSNSLDDRNNIQIMKRNLDINSLTLVTAINYKKLYQEFGYTRMLIVEIGVVFGIVFVIISILLSHYLTKPIVYLSKKAANRNGNNMVTNGRYLKRADEVGVLCNEFNNMIEELDTVVKREYRNKLILLDSQMKSLEAQINSHFLYNTLESINSIAEIEGVNSISTMSLALGNMFRYSIKTKSELVTIADELQHVQDYISIQKIRFDNRFNLRVDIPQKMYSMKVLKLILQPIVENALYHGLKYCSCGSEICISGHTCEGQIFLQISDDGAGMTTEQLQLLRKSLSEKPRIAELGQRNKESIGLKNINSRIELYYGEGYGLSIESAINEGSRITIRLPVVQELGTEQQLQ